MRVDLKAATCSAFLGWSEGVVEVARKLFPKVGVMNGEDDCRARGVILGDDDFRADQIVLVFTL